MQWRAEKEDIGRLGALREQIEAVKREIEPAERAYDLNRVAELRYGRLADLERRLQHDSDGKGQPFDLCQARLFEHVQAVNNILLFPNL